MKKRHAGIKKRILSALVIGALAVGLCQNQVVLATTKSNAQSKKNSAQSQLDEANSSISNIESKQSALQKEINSLDAELVNLLVEMDVLKGELSDKEDELVQVKADLKQAEETEAAQYEAMKKRIRFMYEKGDTALISAILESKSIADVINQVQYYSDVYDYDQNLQEQLQETRQQVADLKTQVENEKAELEDMQANYEEQESQLQTMVAQKKGQMDNFDDQLASAKSLAAEYKKTIDQQNTIIKEEEAKEKAAQEAAAAQAAAQAAQSSQTVTGNTGGSSSGGSTTTPSTSTTDTSKNPSYATGVSGSSIVSYAMSFVGNRYVWGGTDPNTGADCSGFTQYVFAHYGISLPRTSGSQRSAGQEVSYANAQPGDLICYSGHVAIYIGGGQIVHAQSTATGIVSGTSATYRTILSVRRVL